MFRTIVVGTDGSANAELALAVAASLAADQGSKLHVVSAVRPLTPAQLYELKMALPDEYWPQLHADYFGAARIAQADVICKQHDVDPVSHLVNAEPAEAILNTAEATNADLVVVGSRGESAPGRILHGSVSTKVMHHAHCSILVVKEELE